MQIPLRFVHRTATSFHRDCRALRQSLAHEERQQECAKDIAFEQSRSCKGASPGQDHWWSIDDFLSMEELQVIMPFRGVTLKKSCGELRFSRRTPRGTISDSTSHLGQTTEMQSCLLKKIREARSSPNDKYLGGPASSSIYARNRIETLSSPNPIRTPVPFSGRKLKACECQKMLNFVPRACTYNRLPTEVLLRQF